MQRLLSSLSLSPSLSLSSLLPLSRGAPRHHAKQAIIPGLEICLPLVLCALAYSDSACGFTAGTNTNTFISPPLGRRQIGGTSTTVHLADDPSPSSDDCIMRIFTDDIPLLDVRAEVEFEKGAFPNSVNMPILNDEQRHLVGTCYKEIGPEAAFDLGEELVTPFKEERISAWKNHAQENPAGYVYCFRGGSRSQITQSLLKEAGVDYPLVAGGYKAMRQFLIEELERVPDLPIIMIGGRTASGKTHLLKHFTRHVDLEGIANHRGSTFGALVDPQPTPINFENEVAIEFLKLRQSGSLAGQNQQQQPIFIEEEGRHIGRLSLPSGMHDAMIDRFPVVELETPMEDRVRICVDDYVTDMFPLFVSAEINGDLDLAHEKFREAHLNSLGRIKKRVQNYEEVNSQLIKGLDLFQRSNGIDVSGFSDFTESILQYYDKMYDYQMDQRKGEVLFRGDSKSIIEWSESEEGLKGYAML